MNRRFRSKQQLQTRTATHKLVCFQFGNERYAIAIEKVLRVVNDFQPQGMLASGRSLVENLNETITLIDPSRLFLTSNDPRPRQYLIVCKLNADTLLGIPISEMPGVLEITTDKFEKVPEIYQQGHISEAVAKIIHTGDNQLVFYLNLENLVTQVDYPLN